jgi:hypothetical protein
MKPSPTRFLSGRAHSTGIRPRRPVERQAEPHSSVINELLAQMGFREGSARASARAVLEDAGLTRPGKERIAASKTAQVRIVLGERFAVVCSRPPCQAEGRETGRTLIDAAHTADCWSCRGRPNSAAIDRAVAALLVGGLRRLAIVGGSPATHRELRRLVDGRVDLQLVDGTARRTSRDARADLRWADLVMVWGGTELDHRVSRLYTAAGSDQVVVCPRRGLAALAETIERAVRSRGRCNGSS